MSGALLSEQTEPFRRTGIQNIITIITTLKIINSATRTRADTGRDMHLRRHQSSIIRPGNM